ncbi:Histone chaperone domain CHZ [Niveomyces insectorum RCEF 264]|uniref:Histone chaperone domain CHZ n=1 Tax=Niveomyces insectorum RCEF 264 TaxID=1081102 RepID=A0A167ZS46_9HYPO|nr:Histone chaperone domain CHZ [Niveomyces insectorum RCEF 264]
MATNGNGVQDPTQTAAGQAVTAPSNEDLKGKGKGKAAPPEDDDMQDAGAHEDDDDDDDEEEEEENVENDDDDEDGEDDLQEIDLDNVVGRRTRGVIIDYAKAAAENPPDEDDEDEDDDFEDPDSKMEED